MNEIVKPLPCPFCGGEDIGTLSDEAQVHKWGRAVCKGCGAAGEEVRTGYDARPDAVWRSEAIIKWNTRKVPSGGVKKLIALEDAIRIACDWAGDIGEDGCDKYTEGRIREVMAGHAFEGEGAKENVHQDN